MTAIEFENISKQYRLGLVSTKTLSHDINRWWQTSVLHKEDPYLKIGETNDRASKGNSDYVWALKDINFKVEQGDVVGIIGKNGAGKSTLLKLLSQVTGPTTGKITAHGRIGSLLEVGTGFHQEMTGRENIYLNGAILGMSRQEITRKLDEIVDFSGCERYIDTPVKRYSSGMMVRLGFAVAAHLDPEILVVDEVLAVGDAEFQKKAIGKMQDVSKGEGRTVLFVSHNMASVRALCHTGMLLENGTIKQIGDIETVVSSYLTLNEQRTYQGSSIIKEFKIIDKNLRINSVRVNDKDTNYVELVHPNLSLTFEVNGFYDGTENLDLEFLLYADNGVLVAKRAQSLFSGKTVYVNNDHFLLRDCFTLPSNLTNGDYYLEIQITHPMVSYLAIASQALKINVTGLFTPQGVSLDRRGHSGAALYIQ